MIKLHLEIQFIRILYNENPKKNHYTNFTLQNEGNSSDSQKEKNSSMNKSLSPASQTLWNLTN